MTTSIDELIPAIRLIESASIEVIESNQSPNGAYVASPTFSVYGYCWLRDGAFIADSMSRVGRQESAARFHEWVRLLLVERSSQIDSLLDRAARGEPISPDDHLPCRYSLDRADGQDDWTNFQLDGYGTWLWALDKFLIRNSLPHDPWLEAVGRLSDYLCRFWAEPSYDWWEESFGHIHVSSIACICVGLERVSQWPELPLSVRERAVATATSIRQRIAKEGTHDGHLTKWLNSTSVDASLLALVSPLGFVSPSSDVGLRTVDVVRSQLSDGGVHRHLQDTYFGGGQWVLLTEMLASCLVQQGDSAGALDALKWCIEQADSESLLPEQVNSRLLAPEYEDHWIEKWGNSARPLLWSHAMFLTLIDELGLVAA